MKRVGCYLIAFSLLVLAKGAVAAVFCVDAATALQTALTMAASNSQADTIKIVQGTYVGNFVYATATEAYDLAIAGGYTTGCASQTIEPGNTILDGIQAGRVLTLSASGLNINFYVKELTLRNGKSTSDDGGGLYAIVGASGTFSLENNAVTGNTVSGNCDHCLHYGGGVAIYTGGGPITLTNNSISDNSSNGSGGGVYLSTPSGTATLTNNRISANSSESSGGGMRMSASRITLTNNSISDNSAIYDGGGVVLGAGTATLTNNTINGNSTSYSGAWGGGVYLGVNTGMATLTNNSISDNSSGVGGGVYLVVGSGTATLTNNSISDNSSGILGGGVYLSAPSGKATLTNNSISANSSVGDGGGVLIHAENGTTTLTNNNISGNFTTYSLINPRGGGVNLNARDGTATLTNNSFSGNSSSEGGGGLYLVISDNTSDVQHAGYALYNNVFWDNFSRAGSDLWIANQYNYNYLPTPITLLGNNFDQTPTGYKSTQPITIGPSNLNHLNPFFVDPDNDDLHLSPGSPMIDAGYADTPNLPGTDLDGKPRVVGGVVDIGAYEFDDSIPLTVLFSAVLPYARSIGLGETATAFGTLINSGNVTATECYLALPAGIPATFTYQTTDASNALIGTPNTPVDIPPGIAQGFVFGIAPTATFPATEIPLIFDCTNSDPAPSHAGVNTFILSASSQVPADLVAIASTVNNDGIVHLDPQTGVGFFAAAAVNIGSAGTITVSADDGDRSLPITLEVCETTATGQRIGSCAASLSRSVAEDETVYYTVNAFLEDGETIPFDPAFNRLFLRFTEGVTTVGATNVAITSD